MRISKRKINRKNIDIIEYLIKVATLFTIYFITAIFGLSIDAVSGFATLVWLPTGISLAALLLFGINLWPAVLFGAFFANYATGAPTFAALGISIGNTLEAVAAAYLLIRIFDIRNSLDRLKDVVVLVFVAAIACTAISATIGTTSLFLAGTVTTTTYGNTWIAWWIGDMISNLITAPLILVWYSTFRYSLTQKQFYELIAAFCYLILSTMFVFTDFFGLKSFDLPLTYLIFPPLIWISLRFSQRETVSATFLVALITLIATLSRSGPFASQTVSLSLTLLQGFMTVTAITFLCIAAIVAERKRLEKIKDDLLTIISHELKTPVTSIKAYTQLLMRQFNAKKDKKVIKYLDRMNSQVDKLTTMINDLLDLSRIQDRKFQIQKKLISLQTLIRETVENIQTTAPDHKIVVKGTVLKKVNADRIRIEQVLVNLLSNAIKYSPDRRKVIVTIKNQSNKVIVGVQDFGVGIDEKYHNQIFKRFFRVSDETRQTGFGIGLYVSREIVHRHGGELWVKSKLDSGSTFYFSLPY